MKSINTYILNSCLAIQSMVSIFIMILGFPCTASQSVPTLSNHSSYSQYSIHTSYYNPSISIKSSNSLIPPTHNQNGIPFIEEIDEKENESEDFPHEIRQTSENSSEDIQIKKASSVLDNCKNKASKQPPPSLYILYHSWKSFIS